MKKTINKIALAYSGGLDTSVMIPWLKDHVSGAEVIAVICDLGQQENLAAIKEKALKSGASQAFVVNVQDEFVTDYLWPLVKSGALYEEQYILGTISRPLIAQKLVEIALAQNADAIAHGATGKGNDQVRFEYTVKALAPQLEIIAPWRHWEIKSRQQAIEYAKAHGIEVPVTPKAPYSRDHNIWYISHEGGVIEDPAAAMPDDVLLMTSPLEQTPDEAATVTLDFEQGVPTAINGKKVTPVHLLQQLNELAGQHGIGVADIVENRLVGMKIRGIYEAPAAAVIYKAHKMLESLCLDRHTLHLKQSLQQQYANLVYEGRWFSPSKKALDAFIAVTQQHVSGSVKLKLFKGNIMPCGMQSPFSLHNPALATFEEDSIYNQKDAEGFINLFSLSAKVYGLVHQGGQDDQ
ncbi:argininosuccinate synthase [Legionella taurinensis]|uniref:Argininosuccinate synthase n=1 Tax=Legionella taurinensis TaxID=70611 RepID=A0A3A5LD76_9GAMM|nr:argininosuccinate synthase [Legionella taurinensis]MDX1838611.1 argininosuccinate synthase [Legionella taurinensis]PUT39049.1 argininosuccinate synthase [Legionella taurinensis]PUT41136.1 argininosuccinate synthase [Legionella taurinensis]PUT43511.1 argininosuccinate synthase [Legionella taurinensis]PUT46528.1 argininosuccinate synthase [Legionella taurinensis]